MSRYFTPTLAALEPYTPGEQRKIPDLVKLNANESPYPPSPGGAGHGGPGTATPLTEAVPTGCRARRCPRSPSAR